MSKRLSLTVPDARPVPGLQTARGVRWPIYVPEDVSLPVLRRYVGINVVLTTLCYLALCAFNWGTTKNDPTNAGQFDDVNVTFLSDGFADDRFLLCLFVVFVLYFGVERCVFELYLLQYLNFASLWEVPWMHWLRLFALVSQMFFILLVGVVSNTEDPTAHETLVHLAGIFFLVHEVLWLILGFRPSNWPVSALHLGVLGACVAFGFCFATASCAGGEPDQAWYEYALFLLFALVPLVHVYSLPRIQL